MHKLCALMRHIYAAALGPTDTNTAYDRLYRQCEPNVHRNAQFRDTCSSLRLEQIPSNLLRSLRLEQIPSNLLRPYPEDSLIVCLLLNGTAAH